MLHEFKRSIYWLFHSPKDFLENVMCHTVNLWPSEFYLKVLFRLHFGYWPNFRNPKTFSEKINWLKLNNIHPEYSRLVDKYEVKKFVASVIGEEYIIPTLGLWNSVDEIDWEKLPQQFVLKSTSDSGSIVICKDKSQLNIDFAKSKLKNLGRRDYAKISKEYPYKNVPHRYIAEAYLEDESGFELKDYKFFCFNGNPKFFKVDFNRQTIHRANYYNLDWVLLPFYEVVCPCDSERTFLKPPHFDQMVNIASCLSRGMPFVRIDLYNVNGKIYFGEITFFPNSGMGKIEPEEWDFRLGEYLKLPLRQ